MGYRIKELNPMQGKAKSSFGAITHRGYIYTVGGHQGAEHTYPPESFSNKASRYNIESKKWESLPSRSVKAHGFQLAAFDKYIYTFGGFAYEENNTPKWKSISIVERLNTKTLKWEVVGHMPRNRSSNTVSVVNDKAYLIGGWDATPKFENDIDGVFHDEIDVYDFTTNSWTTSDSVLPKKRRAFSSFVKNNKIYLVGGISEGGSHFGLLDDFTEFNPKNNMFTEFPKLPFPTFAPASGYLKGRGMIFGGMFKTGKWNYEYVPHIYEFNFNKQSWFNTGRFLKEYKGFSQVVKLNKCLVVLGGHSYKNNQDSPLNSVEKVCK
jgi:N-acetylneuraminic acid mutarotase